MTTTEGLTTEPAAAAPRMNPADPTSVPSTPPAEWYTALAREQAERWQYTITLDPEDLERYVHELAEDPNVQADVDAAYALARPLLVDLQRRLDTVTSERDERLTLAESSRLARMVDDLRAERDRMQAVVTAAWAWRDAIVDPPNAWAGPEDLALIAAVDERGAVTELIAAPAVDAQAPRTPVAEGYGEDAGSSEAQRAAEAAEPSVLAALPDRAAEIHRQLRANGWTDRLDLQQALALAEEAGEFVGAFRRWAGMARRPGPFADVEAELADVVVTAFVTADVLGIDLPAVVAAKLDVIFARGWREAPQVAPNGCAFCGVEEHDHGQRHHGQRGFELWQPPSDEQRLTRMRAGRTAGGEVARG